MNVLLSSLWTLNATFRVHLGGTFFSTFFFILLIHYILLMRIDKETTNNFDANTSTLTVCGVKDT